MGEGCPQLAPCPADAKSPKETFMTDLQANIFVVVFVVIIICVVLFVVVVVVATVYLLTSVYIPSDTSTEYALREKAGGGSRTSTKLTISIVSVNLSSAPPS